MENRRNPFVLNDIPYWLSCNHCLLKYSNDKLFIVLKCGHILCGRCSKKVNSNEVYCIKCKKGLPFKNIKELSPQQQNLFVTNIDDKIYEIQNITRFRRLHLKIFRDSHIEHLKKIPDLKKELKRVTAEDDAAQAYHDKIDAYLKAIKRKIVKKINEGTILYNQMAAENIQQNHSFDSGNISKSTTLQSQSFLQASSNKISNDSNWQVEPINMNFSFGENRDNQNSQQKPVPNYSNSNTPCLIESSYPKNRDVGRLQHRQKPSPMPSTLASAGQTNFVNQQQDMGLKFFPNKALSQSKGAPSKWPTLLKPSIPPFSSATNLNYNFPSASMPTFLGNNSGRNNPQKPKSKEPGSGSTTYSRFQHYLNNEKKSAVDNRFVGKTSSAQRSSTMPKFQ